jgi:cysteine desulfurase/selenocysteine lyase
MPPWQGGGEMILTVTFEGSEWADIPHKFEAGTPNVAGAVGLGATVEYLEAIGMDHIAAWEHELLAHGTELLAAIPEVRPIGTAEHKAGVLSFVLEGVHSHDVGTILDLEGIAVRTGHHCAQPVMDRFGVAATTRASLAFYNTKEELDALGAGLRKVLEVFA